MTLLPRRPLAALVAALAVAASGCDFTPTLDIETPEFEARAVLSAVLAADSIATVRVGVSQDPYSRQPPDLGRALSAVVTLHRDGVLVETLALVTCEPPDDGPRPFPAPPPGPCGAYVGTVPVEAGGTYTVRAEVPGLPRAEGTTTVPLRPRVEAEEVPVARDPVRGELRRFRVRLSDAAGEGERYGLSLLRLSERRPDQFCEPSGGEVVCRDTVYVYDQRGLVPFETSDPVLISAARQVPGDGGVGFVAFTDQTFDGRTFTFEVEGTPYFYYGDYLQEDEDRIGTTMAVQLAALSEEVYRARQIAEFSIDGENPFAEPANFPSNVEGGFGVVGSVALAEVAFPPPRSER